MVNMYLQELIKTTDRTRESEERRNLEIALEAMQVCTDSHIWNVTKVMKDFCHHHKI